MKSGAPLLNVQSVPRPASPQRIEAKATLFEEARLSAKLTVKHLAREARVSESLIYSIEHDKPVKVELAVRACRVLSQHLGYEVTYQSLGMKVIS